MSLSEFISQKQRAMGRLILAGVVLVSLPLSGCTVRPLYSTDSTGTLRSEVSALQQIIIKPADTRPELEVRNHLIFLLNGGAGMPAEAPYSLELSVTSRTANAALVQLIADPTENEGQPTAGVVHMKSNYVLTDVRTGDTIGKGQRSVAANFDQPRQEFAIARAERNAQDRAARELAELLRLALAQDMERIATTN